MVIWRFLTDPRKGHPALIGVLLALSLATKESTFITVFVMGGFFLAAVIAKPTRPLVWGPVSGVGLEAWGWALAAFAAVFTVLFTTFLTHPHGLWDGVYTAEQAKRGEPLYAQHCSSCHGSTFEGGEMAPALAGGAFNANWNGLSLGDLVERIRISMPQNSPNSLTRQQYVDIVATMLSGGEFPQGKSELPRETESLKQIAFESAKRQ